MQNLARKIVSTKALYFQKAVLNSWVFLENYIFFIDGFTWGGGERDSQAIPEIKKSPLEKIKFLERGWRGLLNRGTKFFCAICPRPPLPPEMIRKVGL